DVEVETVFAHAVGAEPIIGAWRGSLHASSSKVVGVADSAPVLDGMRLPPTKIAGRRLRKRDALEAAYTSLGSLGGFHDAVCGFDPVTCETGAERDNNREEPRHKLSVYTRRPLETIALVRVESPVECTSCLVLS